MKSNVNRLLSVLLCACLLLGLIPCTTANAQTVTETKEVTMVEVDENGTAHVTGTTTLTDTYTVAEIPEFPELPDAKKTRNISSDGSMYYFDTFEELKQLAANTYDGYVDVSYQGTEPLVISEDLVLPMNFLLYLWEGQLTVAEGVTLTINWYVNAYDWVINGTVNVGSDAGMYIGNSAVIAGTVNLYGSMPVACGAQITGLENINMVGAYAYPYWSCAATDSASLKAYAETAAADTTGWIYNISVNTDQGSFVLDQSMTLPANCYVSVYGDYSLTVAAGCELKVSGDLSIGSSAVVNGTLNNTGYVYVDYDAGGRLSFANGGTYTGTGTIMIFDYEGTLSEPSAAVPGLDLSSCTITDRTEYHYWEIRSNAGLTKLGTPTDLEWGYEHEAFLGWNSETESPIIGTVAKPGFISWKPGQPDQAHALIQVYREGETAPCCTMSWNFGSTEDVEWRSVDNFANTNPESGTYYFTVTSEGDYTQYSNSETVTSGTWTYTKPAAQLGTCSNLTWNWPELNWTPPADTTYLDGYAAEYWYATTADAEPYSVGMSWWRGGSDSSPADSIMDWTIENNGPGYYYIRVRALSSDITVACNGEWSELSPAYNLTETSDSVGSQLDSIISDTSTTIEQKVDAVQAMDTTELKSAMLADDEVVEQIALLEAEAAGGSAAIYVSEDASEFDVDEVTIVGANLNTTVDDTMGVTLVVDKPEAEHVIPEAYDNSVAVSFSMNLDNVADTENLEVPVQITLPIPSSINPAFLVILHYHANGEIEEIITPYIYNVGDQYYAEFVLTSFSDFMMVQTKCDHEWDDGVITEKVICTDEKTAEYTCTKCGETKTEVLEAAADHAVVHEEAAAPTCTENGNIEYWYCSVCGYAWLDEHCTRNTNLKAVILPAAGHDYVDGVCTVCGAEEGAVVPGDVNGDGEVNDTDVAQLLWHTLFPENYEIQGDADYDHNGEVNDTDVAYLLWHTLFPEKYPIA